MSVLKGQSLTKPRMSALVVSKAVICVTLIDLIFASDAKLRLYFLRKNVGLAVLLTLSAHLMAVLAYG